MGQGCTIFVNLPRPADLIVADYVERSDKKSTLSPSKLLTGAESSTAPSLFDVSLEMTCHSSSRGDRHADPSSKGGLMPKNTPVPVHFAE